MRHYTYFGIVIFLVVIWFYTFVGLRQEHIAMFSIITIMYLAHEKSRQYVLAFVAFITYWTLYDSMRVIPNYEVNPIHIIEPYNFEKHLFGVSTEGGVLTLNEYSKINQNTVLDVIAGFFYLGWVPVPFIFGIWLYLRNKRLFLRFAYAYLLTNIIGIIGYYLYPAAPPWYVEEHGFNIIHGTPGNAAGLLGFDNFLGIHLFENIYTKNANVFAALPSMHSAYPLLCLLYALHMRKKWVNLLFVIFMAGTWFAAVYTRHHYVIDVVAGACTALLGYFLFEFLYHKTGLKLLFDRYLMRI
jgi:hypothetical protein